MRTALPLNSPVSLGMLCARILAILAFLASALGGARMLPAQTPAKLPPSSVADKPAHKPARKPTHKHKRPVAVHAPSPAPQAAVAPPMPPAPEVPAWPANERPAPASVTWDSHGLRIEAANSSLLQILEEISTATGVKVEGFDADQRIFGVYGPGSARDVLSQLLQGSGYNILLVGDLGQGTPRKILLSSRTGGSTAPAANAAPSSSADEDADTEEQPQPQQPQQPPQQQNPPPIRPGFAPGAPQQMPQGTPPANPPN